MKSEDEIRRQLHSISAFVQNPETPAYVKENGIVACIALQWAIENRDQAPLTFLLHRKHFDTTLKEIINGQSSSSR